MKEDLASLPVETASKLINSGGIALTALMFVIMVLCVIIWFQHKASVKKDERLDRVIKENGRSVDARIETDKKMTETVSANTAAITALKEVIYMSMGKS